MKFLEELAARRRFGMKPGLDAIRGVCAALGNPERDLRAVHVAGTNGKGAVCAVLDSCMREAGLRVGRYTSPHLVALNERFFLDGHPASDAALADATRGVSAVAPEDLTFFEALTATAFKFYADVKVDVAVLETGLGGRLDATNVCVPVVTVITRVGLDHCDWLGDTVEKIAGEKAGIIKRGVPVVLGANAAAVRAVVKRRAEEVGAPFVYAPEIALDAEIPARFALAGAFNRENAITALAALKVLAQRLEIPALADEAVIDRGFAAVVWPGRFQRVGDFIIDGAHNPPAARALSAALDALAPAVAASGANMAASTGEAIFAPAAAASGANMAASAGFSVSGCRSYLSGNGSGKMALVAGFCGDKDADEVLRILSRHICRAFAVKTNNPRSLSAEETAAKMTAAGIPAEPCATLAEALGRAHRCGKVLVCGSLFLAGEALVALNAFPYSFPRFDPSERL